jgi:hypothetical protein
MADIRQALQGIQEPDRTIGLLLDEFYRNMKAQKESIHGPGKRATIIVMAVQDIKKAVLDGWEYPRD